MRTLPELVDFIKKEARMRNTSVPKIEVAIGWGNGTIGKWSKAKGYPSLDKLQKVADYLSMSVAELTGDEDIKNPPSAKANGDIEEFMERLRGADPEKIKEIRRYAEYVLGKD